MNGKFNVKAWALAGAIFWGVYVFLVPLFAMGNITFLWFSDGMFTWLGHMYPGLTPTVFGAFIGLLYGVFCGAFCGAVFAWLHNKAIDWLG